MSLCLLRPLFFGLPWVQVLNWRHLNLIYSLIWLGTGSCEKPLTHDQSVLRAIASLFACFYCERFRQRFQKGTVWTWLSDCKSDFYNSLFNYLSACVSLTTSSPALGSSSFKDMKCNRTHHIKSSLVIVVQLKINAQLVDNLVRCSLHSQILMFLCRTGQVGARITPWFPRGSVCIPLMSTFSGKPFRFICHRRAATAEPSTL